MLEPHYFALITDLAHQVLVVHGIEPLGRFLQDLDNVQFQVIPHLLLLRLPLGQLQHG